jgi:hypothetical protein
MNLPEPVPYGWPVPAGRSCGDCGYCQGDTAACDCALRWSTTAGALITHTVRDGRLTVLIDSAADTTEAG